MKSLLAQNYLLMMGNCTPHDGEYHLNALCCNMMDAMWDRHVRRDGEVERSIGLVEQIYLDYDYLPIPKRFKRREG